MVLGKVITLMKSCFFYYFWKKKHEEVSRISSTSFRKRLVLFSSFSVDFGTTKPFTLSYDNIDRRNCNPVTTWLFFKLSDLQRFNLRFGCLKEGFLQDEVWARTLLYQHAADNSTWRHSELWHSKLVGKSWQERLVCMSKWSYFPQRAMAKWSIGEQRPLAYRGRKMLQS